MVISSCLDHSCGIEVIVIAGSGAVSNGHIEVMGHGTSDFRKVDIDPQLKWFSTVWHMDSVCSVPYHSLQITNKIILLPPSLIRGQYLARQCDVM